MTDSDWRPWTEDTESVHQSIDFEDCREDRGFPHPLTESRFLQVVQELPTGARLALHTCLSSWRNGQFTTAEFISFLICYKSNSKTLSELFDNIQQSSCEWTSSNTTNTNDSKEKAVKECVQDASAQISPSSLEEAQRNSRRRKEAMLRRFWKMKGSSTENQGEFVRKVLVELRRELPPQGQPDFLQAVRDYLDPDGLAGPREDAFAEALKCIVDKHQVAVQLDFSTERFGRCRLRQPAHPRPARTARASGTWGPEVAGAWGSGGDWQRESWPRDPMAGQWLRERSEALPNWDWPRRAHPATPRRPDMPPPAPASHKRSLAAAWPGQAPMEDDALAAPAHQKFVSPPDLARGGDGSCMGEDAGWAGDWRLAQLRTPQTQARPGGRGDEDGWGRGWPGGRDPELGVGPEQGSRGLAETVLGAFLTSRAALVAHSPRKVAVKVIADGMGCAGPASSEALAGMPLGRSYRSKAIMAFLSSPLLPEAVIFAMYVHEYGGEAGQAGEVLVECLDSTPLHPDEKGSERQEILSSIMQAYFEAAKERGFRLLHLWVPSGHLDSNYIFCFRSLGVRLRTAAHLACWFRRLAEWATINQMVRSFRVLLTETPRDPAAPTHMTPQHASGRRGKERAEDGGESSGWRGGSSVCGTDSTAGPSRSSQSGSSQSQSSHSTSSQSPASNGSGDDAQTGSNGDSDENATTTEEPARRPAAGMGRDERRASAEAWVARRGLPELHSPLVAAAATSGGGEGDWDMGQAWAGRTWTHTRIEVLLQDAAGPARPDPDPLMPSSLEDRGELVRFCTREKLKFHTPKHAQWATQRLVEALALEQSRRDHGGERGAQASCDAAGEAGRLGVRANGSFGSHIWT